MNSTAPAQPHDSVRRQRPSWVVVGVLVVVVLVLGFQTFSLVHLSGRLDDAKREADASKARIMQLQASASGATTKLAGAINTAMIAKNADPSVFEVRAGDFLGTSWGVMHPAGGGTDMITNFHVIAEWYAAGHRSVKLLHTDEEFPATVKHVDKTADLALLHVTATLPILAVQRMAVLGEPVVVLGEPYGLQDTVTAGVVSALKRKVPGDSRTFIQFDAPINPGNSGGPVMNARGQVVGIASEGLTKAQGLGFAIPVATACKDLSTC